MIRYKVGIVAAAPRHTLFGKVCLALPRAVLVHALVSGSLTLAGGVRPP